VAYAFCHENKTKAIAKAALVEHSFLSQFAFVSVRCTLFPSIGVDG
jgi:hypothetical protein